MYPVWAIATMTLSVTTIFINSNRYSSGAAVDTLAIRQPSLSDAAKAVVMATGEPDAVGEGGGGLRPMRPTLYLRSRLRHLHA